ncbi:hypothetical protein M501DRAFT_1022689 [Patellaria atrata CBS 101060]|uniref:Uncharacterized protein n=1 Tax=Patellaria atrata CBS 101060 TaxID=1346257 RepID=A0A9P4SEJ5_9PEZI|nr:hypothetical protein M501DRAFT_1022689 [Patellaria atrata CBS 101060]
MPPQPPSWPSYGNFPSISNQHHAPNSMVNPPNSQFPGSFNPQFPAAGAGMPFPPPPPPPVGHPGFMPPHTQDMNQQAINFQQFAELFRQGMPWPQSQYPNSNMGQSNPNMSPGQWQQPPQQGGPHGGYGGGGNANFGGNNRGGWQQNQGYGRGGRGGRGRGRGW